MNFHRSLQQSTVHPNQLITADQRAQIMGIAEEKCRWTDYTQKSATVKHMIPSLMSNSTR